MRLKIDLRVEIEVDDEDLEDYENLLHLARSSPRDIANEVLCDWFELIDVTEITETE